MELCEVPWSKHVLKHYNDFFVSGGRKGKTKGISTKIKVDAVAEDTNTKGGLKFNTIIWLGGSWSWLREIEWIFGRSGDVFKKEQPRQKEKYQKD